MIERACRVVLPPLDVVDEGAVSREGDAVVINLLGRRDLDFTTGFYLPEPEALLPGVDHSVDYLFAVGRNGDAPGFARGREPGDFVHSKWRGRAAPLPPFNPRKGENGDNHGERRQRQRRATLVAADRAGQIPCARYGARGYVLTALRRLSRRLNFRMPADCVAHSFIAVR